MKQVELKGPGVFDRFFGDVKEITEDAIVVAGKPNTGKSLLGKFIVENIVSASIVKTVFAVTEEPKNIKCGDTDIFDMRPGPLNVSKLETLSQVTSPSLVYIDSFNTVPIKMERNSENGNIGAMFSARSRMDFFKAQKDVFKVVVVDMFDERKDGGLSSFVSLASDHFLHVTAERIPTGYIMVILKARSKNGPSGATCKLYIPYGLTSLQNSMFEFGELIHTGTITSEGVTIRLSEDDEPVTFEQFMNDPDLIEKARQINEGRKDTEKWETCLKL